MGKRGPKKKPAAQRRTERLDIPLSREERRYVEGEARRAGKPLTVHARETLLAGVVAVE